MCGRRLVVDSYCVRQLRSASACFDFKRKRAKGVRLRCACHVGVVRFARVHEGRGASTCCAYVALLAGTRASRRALGTAPRPCSRSSGDGGGRTPLVLACSRVACGHGLWAMLRGVGVEVTRDLSGARLPQRPCCERSDMLPRASVCECELEMRASRCMLEPLRCGRHTRCTGFAAFARAGRASRFINRALQRHSHFVPWGPG